MWRGASLGGKRSATSMELAAVLAIKAPWVSTAPLGTPVEGERRNRNQAGINEII